MKMHCTTCANSIKNTLRDHFQKDLSEDIGENKIYIRIDESTDTTGLITVAYPVMYTVKLHPYKCLTDLDINQCDTNGNWTVSYILFKNVKNMLEIHQSLLKGEVQAALVKPSLIVDLFQITVAANRALRSKLYGKMSTKTVFTEVIYNLSPNRKIGQALKNFGIESQDSEMLAVILSDTAKPEASHIYEIVDGEPANIEYLTSLRDENAIKKNYKLKEEEIKDGCLLESILGRMACKEFT